MSNHITETLMSLDPAIRYVEINTEAPPEGLKFCVPTPDGALEKLHRSMGVSQLDASCLRFVALGYGAKSKLLFPYRGGYVGIGIEPTGDMIDIAYKISRELCSKKPLSDSWLGYVRLP